MQTSSYVMKKERRTFVVVIYIILRFRFLWANPSKTNRTDQNIILEKNTFFYFRCTPSLTRNFRLSSEKIFLQNTKNIFLFVAHIISKIISNFTSSLHTFRTDAAIFLLVPK
jgi:hypothetical protein